MYKTQVFFLAPSLSTLPIRGLVVISYYLKLKLFSELQILFSQTRYDKTTTTV